VLYHDGIHPDGSPIGLLLAATSKDVGRAFTSALAERGGSIPVWLILSTLKREPQRSQLELARAVGIEGPTLTRHLDGMENDGLVSRRRGGPDRRAVQVELTRAGHALHTRLLKAVIDFNERLRDGLSPDDVEALRMLLQRLRANVRTDLREPLSQRD
jgi:MarR family transcriptional regulator, transcriptional regulator for hemolysin